MKNKHGFTLVELIVVIAILGVLTTVAVFNYLNVQRHARDQQRLSDAVIVSEGLEKFFADHGEYPNVARVTNTNGDAVKQLLGLTSLDALIAPSSPAGTTNSWKTGVANSASMVTYSGNTDTSAACNTSTITTDTCDDFKIQYYNEEDGSVKTIYSRNKAAAVDTIAREGVVAPDAPDITATLVGNDATATATAVTCQAGATAKYAFQNRVNNGTWSAWTAWGTGTTNSVPANQGSKYGFRVKAQCVIGTTTSTDSAISSEATYLRPISTPAAPVLSVAAAADQNSGTWSWPATACPTGTSAQYVTTYFRDDSTGWRAYNYASTQTTTSVTYTTNYEGYEYRAKAQTRCVSSFATSGWSADSNTPGFINPVTTPGVAYNFQWSSYNGTPIFTWSEPSCGLGTQLERRYWGYHMGIQYFADGSSSTTGGTTDIFNSTRSGSDTFAQWQSNEAFAASQLDMSIVNLTGFVPAASQGPGWAINTGSPYTNSQDDKSVRAVVQLRCTNTVTGRNAAGNYVMSAMFTR